MRKYCWQTFVYGYGDNEAEALEDVTKDIDSRSAIIEIGNPLCYREVDPKTFEDLDEIRHVCS